MQVEWINSLATGIVHIDDDHREIFRRFNLLLTACEKGRGSDEIHRLVDFLDTYVTTHFRDEEEVQQQTGYPHRDRHIEEHRAFAARFADLREKIHAQGVSVHLVVKTAQLLAELLFDHISVADAAFAGHVRECPATEFPPAGE